MITNKKHLECNKYFIEGDRLFYEFFNDASFDNVKDYCLSIGTCSFYPIKQEPSFRYDLYIKYLNKCFGIVKQKGIIFSNFQSKPFSTSGEQYDTIDVIDTKSQISLDDIGKGSRFIWNSFKRSADPIPLEQFKERFLQSRKVENMKENEYAVLKFGQFKDVYPFLKSMNQVKEGWVAIAKFKNYIYRCNFVCPWKGDTLCTRSCLIIMNTLHQTIFIQYKGSHGLDYDKNNKELCYPAFRNLYLVKWKRSRCPFRDLRRRYKDIYREYVCALGVTPTASTILRWLSSVNKGNFLDSGIRTDDVHDYNKSSEIMLIVRKY